MTARNPRPMPFLLETEDGVRRMIAGIEARRRLVHFPWQLSLPMKYLVRNLPGFLYEPIAARFDPNRKKKA
ncbi:MAG: short-chain dehydrogenase, partial [Elusimicrobiota bacterium]